MCVVALFATGKFPRVTGEFWPVSKVGEDTFGYGVRTHFPPVLGPV